MKNLDESQMVGTTGETFRNACGPIRVKSDGAIFKEIFHVASLLPTACWGKLSCLEDLGLRGLRKSSLSSDFLTVHLEIITSTRLG